MRIKQIGNISISYPSELTYERDSHFIEVTNAVGAVGGVTITINSSLLTSPIMLSYTSGIDRLRVNLREVVRTLMATAREAGDSMASYTLDIASDAAATSLSLGTIYIAQGQSLANRTHFAECVALITPDADEVELWTPSPNDGSYTIAGMETPFTASNWGKPIPITSLVDRITLKTAGHPQTRGELGEFCESVESWTVELRRTCAAEKEVVVRWCNADGMRRECIAQVMDATMKSDGDVMHRQTDELRHAAYRHITEVKQSLRLGFANIPHRAYLEDILMSDEVVIVEPTAGRIIAAVPTTQSLGNIDDTDVVIDFEILN